MIETMFVFGLIFGRWWKTTLIVGAVAWPVLLLVANIIEIRVDVVVVAAVLAFLNTAAGVAVHQIALFAVRRFRGRQQA